VAPKSIHGLEVVTGTHMSANRRIILFSTICVIWLCSGLAGADYESGLAAFKTGDFAKAFTEWEIAAKAGDPKAQHGLGVLYETGQGVPAIDEKKAAELYQAAADQEYAPAISNLARLYEDGRGVTKDQDRAIDLWRRAADLGNSTALYNLGAHYADGIGVPQNDLEAAKYFRAAAELGLPDAQYAMYRILSEGIGIPADKSTAMEWLQKAAAGGHLGAKEDLAALPGGESADQTVAASMEDGAEGLPFLKSPNESHRVFRVWLGQSGQETDAKSQWAMLQQRYRGVLGKLELDLRRYYLGEAKGSIYRIFAGPFDDRDAAQATCKALFEQEANQFCRVVIN